MNSVHRDMESYALLPVVCCILKLRIGLAAGPDMTLLSALLFVQALNVTRSSKLCPVKMDHRPEDGLQTCCNEGFRSTFVPGVTLPITAAGQTAAAGSSCSPYCVPCIRPQERSSAP
jgi:hypothetical protein